MDKQEFRVMSFYVLSIGILSLVMSLVAPPMVSQVLLFMVSSAGLVLWGLYAMFTKDERRQGLTNPGDTPEIRHARDCDTPRGGPSDTPEMQISIKFTGKINQMNSFSNRAKQGVLSLSMSYPYASLILDKDR